MPNTTNPDRLVRQLTASTAQVLRSPTPGEDPTTARIHRVRRIIALAGSLATVVQVIVWLLIAILGPGLDAPWWLFTFVPTVLTVLALSAAIGVRTSSYGPRVQPR